MVDGNGTWRFELKNKQLWGNLDDDLNRTWGCLEEITNEAAAHIPRYYLPPKTLFEHYIYSLKQCLLIETNDLFAVI